MITEPKPQVDYLKKDGARLLAKQLDDYWYKRGYLNVMHWAEAISLSGKESSHLDKIIWVVRSNLVNALPPDTPLTKSVYKQICSIGG